MPKENPPKIKSVENMSVEELIDEVKNTKTSKNFFKANRNAKQNRRLEDIRNELDRRKEAEDNTEQGYTNRELARDKERVEINTKIKETREKLEDFETRKKEEKEDLENSLMNASEKSQKIKIVDDTYNGFKKIFLSENPSESDLKKRLEDIDKESKKDKEAIEEVTINTKESALKEETSRDEGKGYVDTEENTDKKTINEDKDNIGVETKEQTPKQEENKDRAETEENSDNQEESNEEEEEMEHEYSMSELEEILEDRRGMYEQSLKEKYSKKQIEYFKTTYDRARVALGQKMNDERKDILERSGWKEYEIAENLEKYRANEIYQKIYLEEKVWITQIKAEILPSTTQKVLNKTWDWSKKALQKYSELNKMGKTLFKIGDFEVTTGFLSKQVALATLFGFASPLGAGLGIGTRIARGIAGASMSQFTKKHTDRFLNKHNTNSEKYYDEDIASLKTSFDMGIVDVIEYEKRLSEINRNVKFEKRYNILAGMGASILAGVGTSMAVGDMIEGINNMGTDHTETKTDVESNNSESVDKTVKENIETEKTIVEEKPDTEKVRAEEKPDTEVEKVGELKPFKVEVKSSSIATLEELKSKLKLQYPDASKAPDNVRHILNTNSVSLSQEWGLFNSGDANESAMMLKGSTISVDGKGNITLHNLGKGETVLSGENAEKYHDKMFDYDGQKASTSNYEARGSGTPERSANVVDNDPNPDESELVSREEIEKMAENNRAENTGEVDRSGESVVTDDKGNRAPVEDNSLGENRERSFVDTYKENVAAYNEEARLTGRNSTGYRTNNGLMNTTDHGMRYGVGRPRVENPSQDQDVPVNEQEQIDYIAEQEFRSEVNEIFGRRFLGTPISDGIKTNEWAYLKDSKISIGEKGAVTLTTENGTVSGRGADDVYESSGGGRSAKVVDRLEKFIKNQDIKPTSGESVEAYLKRVARAQK